MPAVPAFAPWPTPAALAAAWEATATPSQLAAQAPYQEAIIAWLTAFHLATTSPPPHPGNLDMADAATVMREAAAIRAARASTAGPTRAAAAVQQLRAALPPAVGSQPARRALLFITSSPATPLEMDELSEITETIHTTLLHDNGEMIFGHDEHAIATGGDLHVWLLLGYQA